MDLARSVYSREPTPAIPNALCDSPNASPSVVVKCGFRVEAIHAAAGTQIVLPDQSSVMHWISLLESPPVSAMATLSM
jgi:hypothetical protein